MKQKHNLFSKTIALAMAILIASTTLTGCSWFSSRQDESSQEVVLEAPEPDAQDPGEDIVDDSEVTADEDPTIQSDEEENVVEEPDTTTTGSNHHRDHRHCLRFDDHHPDGRGHHPAADSRPDKHQQDK